MISVIGKGIFLGRSGLTVLELVVALATAMLLAALAIPQISRYWQVYQLDAATQTLVSSLELARYSAISRNVDMVVSFDISSGSYQIFEDKNKNGSRDGGEILLRSYSLPKSVDFSGSGLVGPPSSPSGPVADPITFSGDRLVFNAMGKLNAGLGTIYVQNTTGDAAAVSFNIASRLKTYRWDKSTLTWK